MSDVFTAPVKFKKDKAVEQATLKVIKKILNKRRQRSDLEKIQGPDKIRLTF